MTKGGFITLEGGEGAGKSTQIRLLQTYLEEKGNSCLITREPGGSQGAEMIRELLVKGDVGRWDGMTEALLNFAARRDHLVKTVWPALEAGTWVISDRFADSTIAYQGYGYGNDLKQLYDLWDLTIDGFKPDMTFMLDIPVEKGLSRALSRNDGEDRYEKMQLDFHNNLRNGFIEIAKNDPKRCMVIDATQSIEEIQSEIRHKIDTKYKDLF